MTNEQIMEYKNYIMSLTKYFEGYKNKEDLFQVGCIGLMNAYSKFDPSYGVKFSTYAYSHILGEMKKLVRTDKGIKISRNITKLKLKIEKANILLSQKLMRMPTIKELSEFLGVDENLITDSIATTNIIQSIDEPISLDSKEVTLHDYVAEKREDINTLIALREELNNLSKEERNIIEGRYLYDLTQSEIAKKLGMTQVQVSRKEKKIKQKIKTELTV